MNKKIYNATKWSMMTELISKAISPITNILLARILTPEAFGVVATITMVTTFAQMFSDAGFHRYLVQHEFKNEEEKNKYSTVAFWTNLSISLMLWIVVAIFSEPIAELVGNPGLGNVIMIACISLPLTAFSSIQMALYIRVLNYRTLFFTKLIGICIPFVVTIPLALLGYSYWALIVGTILSNLSNAIILTAKSKWKPKKFFSIAILKEMLSFSVWLLIEAISIWLTTWIDTFIVGSILNAYYLGIYKTSINTVSALMSIITGSTISVLLSTLSRLQGDRLEYEKVFLKFQRIVGLLVMPMSVGIFMFHDLITSIMLGNQWSDASLFIGLLGLTSGVVIVFCNFSSIAFISQGKPKLSFFAQILYLVALVPTVLVSVQYGFTTLVYARSLICLQFIIVQLVIMHYIIKISPLKMIKNVLPSTLSAVAMGGVAYLCQKLNNGTIWSLMSVVICIISYFSITILFPSLRKDIFFIKLKLLNIRPRIKLYRFNRKEV